MSAASLIDIRETLEDQGHEQAHEDVHADNIPRYEQGPCPGSTAAIAVEELRTIVTVGVANASVILHDGVPAFATTHAEQENKGFRHVPEIQITSLGPTKPRKTQSLGKSDGIG